jgi:hypothetical protein
VHARFRHFPLRVATVPPYLGPYSAAPVPPAPRLKRDSHCSKQLERPQTPPPTGPRSTQLPAASQARVPPSGSTGEAVHVSHAALLTSPRSAPFALPGHPTQPSRAPTQCWPEMPPATAPTGPALARVTLTRMPSPRVALDALGLLAALGWQAPVADGHGRDT